MEDEDGFASLLSYYGWTCSFPATTYVIFKLQEFSLTSMMFLPSPCVPDHITVDNDDDDDDDIMIIMQERLCDEKNQ
jgi:hypothetical protein